MEVYFKKGRGVVRNILHSSEQLHFDSFPIHTVFIGVLHYDRFSLWIGSVTQGCAYNAEAVV